MVLSSVFAFWFIDVVVVIDGVDSGCVVVVDVIVMIVVVGGVDD